jgi:hypothetical protein
MFSAGRPFDSEIRSMRHEWLVHCRRLPPRLIHRRNLGLHQPIAHSIANERGRGCQAKLAHDGPAVRFDSLDADIEDTCDHLVAEPFGDKLDNASLAIRQYVILGLCPQERIEQRFGCTVREKRLVRD